MKRIDTASKSIRAPVAAVYDAFRTGHALEQWLPPTGMSGQMSAFDFREGGFYRIRLTYEDATDAPGKTADDADDAEVRFIKLIDNQQIEQQVVFESDKPEFQGVMTMTWTFQAVGAETRVMVACEDVPPGIGQADHQAGIAASLDNLARFVEQRHADQQNQRVEKSK